jgi:hypothetical protein
MDKIPKERIIATYHRLVKQHGGVPIGERIFTRESGISHHYWKGGYWRSWSSLQAEAGFEPNSASEKTPDAVLLRCYAELTIELGNTPSEADLMIKRREDPTFPAKSAYRRWGNGETVRAKVAEYCESHPDLEAALKFLSSPVAGSNSTADSSSKGFVYLLRSGKSYKLGRTNAIGRRLRELSIQLPQKPDVVHVIETDDPEGIEQYWHRRFAEKRQGGEWFVLTLEDVRAFKKRRFQ